MSNRLAGSLSPYLLQHAENPVSWHPWGDEAFAEARARDVPLLLSIGYSACHWCHVMAHESFENEAIAGLMNDSFVNVKVDREERPDVDAIYMNAVQMMTGSGGWPLTVFLTPAGEPFYGGTYFPPHDRHGAPGFPRVLQAVSEAWTQRREQVTASAAELTAGLRQGAVALGPASAEQQPSELFQTAVATLTAAEDTANGGFGQAPKFPPHSALLFLLSLGDERAERLAVRTLDAMAAGGIFDQLAGGFFRYSVDDRWRVPHFEKMAYDNAQLLRAYARAYRVTGEVRHKEVAYRISDWLEAELKVEDDDGAAFISALDADSEGEEGRFYAWSAAEFRDAIAAAGGDPELAAARFGVDESGDFEGGNVLHLARSSAELASAFERSEEQVQQDLDVATGALLAARSRRIRPAADDKVLTSWNGLLLVALAEAGAAFGDERLVSLAGDVARFLEAKLWRGGRLLHVWRGGEARVAGLLEDHAFLGLGLIAYYRESLEPSALLAALRLADELESDFADPSGGYFNTAAAQDSSEPALIVRPKGLLDGATPSENAAAAELAWWAARYRSDPAAAERATSALTGVEVGAAKAPQAFGTALRLLALDAAAPREVVLVAERDAPELAAAVAVFRRLAQPSDVILQLDASEHPLAALPLATGRLPEQAAAGITIYLCRAGVCRLPVSSVAEFEQLLQT